VGVLSEEVGPLAVVAAPEQELPCLPGQVIIVRDEQKGRGPLQGLAAGLPALRGHADAAFVSGCDVPFLKPALVRRLIELLGEHAICVPKVGDYHHPLSAVYRVEVAEAVASLLAENQLRPMLLFERVPTRVVSAAELVSVDPDFRSLRNLNSPEDYEQALADHERMLRGEG